MAIDLRRAEPTQPRVLAFVVAGLTLLLAFIAVAVGTDTTAVTSLDENVADSAYGFSEARDGFVSFLDSMAIATNNLVVGILLALAAAFAVRQRENRVAIWIVVSAVAVIGGNALLKLIFERERPFRDNPLHEIGGYSFPSGHAAGAGLFCAVAIILTILVTGRGWRRRIIIVWWALLGIAVAANRLYLGVHYLSDVVAGLLFGVTVTLGLWLLIAAKSSRQPYDLATFTGAGRKQAAVVLNPVKVGDIEVFKANVLAAATRHGWHPPIWYETSIEDPGHGQALEALTEGVDLIIAAGGDGTVRAVCEEAARTGIAVGILPHGTGNLLARNLGIPLNIRDALDVVFTGQDRAIDLATFVTDSGTDTCFLVMAGLGMDAAIMNGVDDDLKKKVGWLAYFVSGAKALRYPAMKVQISVDDGEFKKFRARTVVVGNVGFLQAGIPLLPHAQIDDGLLDVVVLAPKRFLGWLAIVVRVIGRQKRTNERLDRMTGRKVVIRAEKPVPMQLDGDPAGEGSEIRAEVDRGILLVRVPVAPAPLD